jgi:hypothetical protein
MEKMKPFNPMPETLDDTGVDQNIILGQNRGGPVPNGVFGDPGAAPGPLRQQEIDGMVRNKLTDEALNKEILDEKIRQDIAASKNMKTSGDARSPRDFLKLLIAKGEYKEDVVIFGQTWTLRALNQGDIISAFNDIKDFSSTVEGKINTVLLSQISFSIEALNGISIYEWFSDVVQRNEFSTTEEYKVAVRRVIRRYFEQMSNSVIKEFDVAYGKIETKRNEAIAELKNS